ncbi:SWIM zinc finger family protein [Peribacillus sp. SCS-37]|uniref:SWIM zinc finger family protein n=1 Tax=Paraperibacillus esterisolvens TaxID=3115296 RepID=UPI003905EDCC
MQTLTESYIDSLAPNASAVKNGWGLVKKNQFLALHRSEDGSLLFGECSGSGKGTYRTSVDFAGESPVPRCSCPSRQFPCKHALGLMYSFVSGAGFTAAPVPEDILEKRDKALQIQEKKKTRESAGGARKVNKSALQKKLQVQLEGLDLLELQVLQLVRQGLAAMDPKKLKGLEDTAKQLGNHYLKEAQNELRGLILLWQKNTEDEHIYPLAYEKLQTLYALCKNGRQHLAGRLADPELALDTQTGIEEWLGHVWQLQELKEKGLTAADVSLAQLSFQSIRSEERKEFIDEGIWLNLNDGKLYCTRNYRPFRAAKHIKEEDSSHYMTKTPELFIYPGEGMRRVRWESAETASSPDPAEIKKFAEADIAAALKAAKNQMKQPLGDKHPAALLNFARAGMVDGAWMLEGRGGVRVSLVEKEGESQVLSLLHLLPAADLQDQVMLVRFYHDIGTGTLGAQPLSIITSNRIVRLLG